MPPSRSGIADYSAALVESLSKLADITTFDGPPPAGYQPETYDAILYQIGNNGFHSFVWEEAIRTPGIVVLHESNLHHLVAETTILRDNWDGYLQEVGFEGGAAALERGLLVRARKIGPDYEGLPMLRRVLSAAKGVVVHSHFVETDVRGSGFAGPVAVIPHGAWIPEADRLGYRERLGVRHGAPLVGIFGHLKPYKRIAEALRAFRRVVRVQPEAKMILVGEPHPDFPVHSLVASLGLTGHVKITGHTAIPDFVGYIAASDIVLNLRWPTVGETSGTLLRALGLARAVIVSDVGSFSEYPDDICLKVPVDAGEEDTLFEYLSLLVSRPAVRESLGSKAKAWVERECSWPHVAELYLGFLDAVREGRTFDPAPVPSVEQQAVPEPPAEAQAASVSPEYLYGWAADDESRSYITTHLTRLQKTLAITPQGGPGKRILEMGAYLQITAALRTKLGYEEVRGCYYGTLGNVDRKEVVSAEGEHFTCEVDLFDAEKDRFPYPDEAFDTVLCGELIEHLPSDPMHMMSEVNRILKPGGTLVITTPNICSTRALSAILQGYHPGFFPAYIRPAADGSDSGARHAREYAPRELAHLYADAGFDLTLLETGEFRDEPHPEHEWVRHILTSYQLSQDLRGDGLYAVGVKVGPVRERFPSWLYS